MNKINFAQSKNKVKTGWSPKITASFIITIVSLVIFLQFKQWNSLQSVKKEKAARTKKVARLGSILQEKSELEKIEVIARKKLEKIEKVKNNPHTYFEIFNEINQTLRGVGSLESLSMFQKNLELTISCASIKEATRFMQSITELPFVSSLELVSIHPKASLFSFKMSGKLA